jgi:hypothetical protein
MLVLLLLLAPSLLLRLQKCLVIVVMKTWLRVCMELWLIVFAVCILLETGLVVRAESYGFVFASGMRLDSVGGVMCC